MNNIQESREQDDLHDDDKKPSTTEQVIGKVTAALRADDDMNEVLKAFTEFKPNAIEKSTVEEARAQPTVADAVEAVLKKQGEDIRPQDFISDITTQDVPIHTATGTLRARIYTPRGDGPFPVIVYFHGGGWVLADLSVYDGGARGLAARSKSIVVSVDYRRAPEAKFPAAWDDAFAAYQWVEQNAESFNGDSTRLALAGESAGGNLAIATAIAVRDVGMTAPRHVLAVYPVTQTGNLNTFSYLENAMAVPLNRAMIPWFLDHLFSSEEEKQDTRVDLVHADLHGLPEVTIINAQLDPLRSDGEILEEALQQAGVAVEREDYSGVTHEFFGMAAVVKKAAIAQEYAASRLYAAFNRPPG